uniref:Complement factor B n=1 Tax=Anolis carolinensis TaxID=28377 RepID=G1KLB5_ANOCA
MAPKLLLFLLCALLTFCPVVDAQEPATPSCPINVAIRGGTVTFSDEGRLGSTLTYSCPPGTYPYPLQSRVCQSDGKWTPMRSPHGPRVNTAQCREIRCPPQMSFEHGSSSPRRSSHPIGDILSFECYDGYQLHGSSQRHCLPNGRWNGTSPVYHGNATGTNTYAALDAIYRMMINDRANVLEKWDKVRHAIILLTDGKSNLGRPPKDAVRSIEGLVNVGENRKDYLDPKDLDDICGLANYSINAEWYQKNPWHVLLQENHQTEPSCRGALISKTWILTSAHCFNKLNDISTWRVILGGESSLSIKRRIDHDLYNVRAKLSQGIQEFYDYDISLLELENPVPFGGRIRPICLPCTEGANKALKKKSGTTTCKDHELELLSFEKVPAQFISLDNKRMNVRIKTKTSRPSCISGAVQEGMIYSQVSDASEVVTDRFLCSGDDNGVEAATCKDIHCNRPVEFENGMYEPRQPYYNVSQELTFECYGGYTMRGSQKRTCLPNGKWSGETTICDDGAGHCRNPGIPIGARKAGTQYRIEYKVQYTCERGLSLVGSKERVCQESGVWSGAEPECRSPFSYDTPEEVSSKFISSLTETAESSDSDKNVSTTGKRKIKIEKDGSLNIYIVLDASRSIKKDQFKHAQNMSIKLIEKISSYDISPRYAVITFATEVKELVRTTDDQSTDASWVIEKLEGMKYTEHKQKPGTNIQKGLSSVYSMMITQQAAERRRGLNPPPVSEKTRHVIVLLSDGDYNMGGDPIRVIRQIREFLNIGRNRTHPREDFLDVYVFAVGGTVVMENVNKIASQKSGERHAFKIKDYSDLQLAFEEMIDESETLSMCGLAKEHDTPDHQQKNPWYTKITIRRTGGVYEHCKGALVSKYFILTAAHCFTIDDIADQITVTIDKKPYNVKALYSHPNYQIGRLANKGIPEFYDYDVALVELASPVMPSPPYSLPLFCGPFCFTALTQYSWLSSEEELLPTANVNSLFVTECNDNKELRRRTVRIKNGDQKFACEEDAKKADQYKNVTNVADVVTDRFLCTGGFDPEWDPNTCKGEHFQYRYRYRWISRDFHVPAYLYLYIYIILYMNFPLTCLQVFANPL